MTLYFVAIGALLLQSALHIWVSAIHRRQWMSYIERKEAEWQDERKDLLDRIQAPSFAEYTNKIVKEKKLEQPQEEEEQVDPYIA